MAASYFTQVEKKVTCEQLFRLSIAKKPNGKLIRKNQKFYQR
jgi:hypothetical protein